MPRAMDDEHGWLCGRVGCGLDHFDSVRIGAQEEEKGITAAEGEGEGAGIYLHGREEAHFLWTPFPTLSDA